MQVIIIESVEALAIQIERELIKHSCDAPVVDSILSCLHPIEVPESVVELVERIEQTMCGIEGEPGHENVVIDIKQAAAMIEAYAKQVPEKLLSIIYNMPPEFYSDWLDHAKEICQDFGYTVKEE